MQNVELRDKFQIKSWWWWSFGMAKKNHQLDDGEEEEEKNPQNINAGFPLIVHYLQW